MKTFCITLAITLLCLCLLRPAPRTARAPAEAVAAVQFERLVWELRAPGRNQRSYSPRWR